MLSSIIVRYVKNGLFFLVSAGIGLAFATGYDLYHGGLVFDGEYRIYYWSDLLGWLINTAGH